MREVERREREREIESLFLSGALLSISSPPYEATLRLIPGGMTGHAKEERSVAGARERGRDRGNKAPGREENKEKRRAGGSLSLLKATARHQQPPHRAIGRSIP
jgi:hypothetical protein